MDLLRFITAGSVDDSKSTLIGRLLYDSKSILADQLEVIEHNGKIIFIAIVISALFIGCKPNMPDPNKPILLTSYTESYYQSSPLGNPSLIYNFDYDQYNRLIGVTPKSEGKNFPLHTYRIEYNQAGKIKKVSTLSGPYTGATYAGDSCTISYFSDSITNKSSKAVVFFNKNNLPETIKINPSYRVSYEYDLQGNVLRFYENNKLMGENTEFESVRDPESISYEQKVLRIFITNELHLNSIKSNNIVRKYKSRDGSEYYWLRGGIVEAEKDNNNLPTLIKYRDGTSVKYNYN
jgi:hypothetical protein